MKFWKKLLYSIRNLWYWKPRCLTTKECTYCCHVGIDDPRRALTELLLISVGLRVINEDSGELDGVYLTNIQREAIGQAKERGYYAGLG